MSWRALQGAAVLVTGGTGFVGAHLVRRLLGLGAVVQATGRDPRRLAGLSVPVHAAPLSDTEGLRALVRRLRPSFVFHLAASTARARELSRLSPMLVENGLAAAALCEAAGESGARVVLVGSAEEYGQQPGPWTEDTPPAPVSPYGVSKLAATEAGRCAARLGLGVAVARPSVIYGPGQDPKQFIPELLGALSRGEPFAMSPGEQRRDFLYVDDVVEGLLALARPEAAGEVFHLCAGEGARLLDVARAAQRLVGRGVLQVGSLPYRPNEVMDQAMSNLKARQRLGWAPSVPLEEGLRRTLAALS